MEIVEFICHYCNKPFTRKIYPSTRIPEFCSPSCRNKARILDDVPCPVCGKMFKPNINDIVDGKSVRKKYCSSKCASFSMRGLPSTNPDKVPDDEIQLVRELCKTKFYKEIADITGRSVGSILNIIYRYCQDVDKSKAKKRQYEKASERMKASNPMFSKKTRQKVAKWNKEHPEAVRKRAVHASRENHRKNPSSLEYKAREILDSMSINYEPSFIIKDKFVVDIKINNLIIEIDGEYWHGHPRFEPLTERQKKQQKRDRARNKYLRTCGYSVERIWGRDVTKKHIKSILEKYGIV